MASKESNAGYDVAVIGGGPAGAAAATFLQRQGHRCIVFENATFPRYHIGESLIPSTYGPLERLGLLPALKASHFPKKYSVRFVSPSGEEADPFYFSETIEGERAQTWQVERSEFDTLCLDNARASGVEVHTATGCDRVLFDGERAVGVRCCNTKKETHEVRSKIVVDASGRASLIGAQLGLTQPVPGLEKASIWSYYRGGKLLQGIDAGETTVFMLERRGWFWYIPLPNDIVSVGVVADLDYLFQESADFVTVFEREVKRCTGLWERLANAKQVAPVRGLRRLAYRNREVVGDGWVMIGDAAAFLDPIYSSGLFLALGSAELAADCIHNALEDNDCSAQRLGGFVPALWGGLDVVRRLIHAFYDPTFSFRNFTARFPDQRAALIDCLVGDVINRDMGSFLSALAIMTPPPPALS